ncbi:MAG: tRNA (adenosine(37)-N6)-dimethylallyltransferase MiaA [Bacteroidota bacterium]|nr:tRNA (adenosine(37)-N6)-dimethylallyltransferase MiaA [Bacteroidota bacterium]
MDKLLIVVLGPTGIGKTDIGIDLARHFNTGIISSDSRQMYRELKIGTAKPSAQQLAEVKHYFIDNLSINDYYNASLFEVQALEVLDGLFKTNNCALLVGGSGLYINALCQGIDDLPTIDPAVRQQLLDKFHLEGIEGLRLLLKNYDPEYYAQADLKNHKRILKALEVTLMTGKPYSSFLTRERKNRDFKIIKIGLNRPREELYQIIDLRVDQMIEAGLVDEARKFFPYRNLNALNTVGYKEFFEYFDHKISLETAISLIKRDSRRYAKRQISWFMRDKDITWFHPSQKEELLNFILSVQKQNTVLGIYSRPSS